MSQPLQIIMIDNYDSFTYNLVNQFRLIGADVVIYRNDTPIADIFTEQRLQHENTVIVISPGPGNPDSAGNSLEIIKQYAGQLPILGICLGHQSIIQHFGGCIEKAKTVVHGKADDVFIKAGEASDTIFNNLSNPFRAARYHSLAATDLSDELEVIASSTDEVMAIKHRTHKILGFQFHPESILTTYGNQLLSSSINWLISR